MSTPGHVQLWPSYLPRKNIERNLATYEENGAICGETRYPLIAYADTWQEFKSIVFFHNLLTFVESLAAFPWLEDALAEGQTLYPNKAGEPVSLCIRGPKRQTRWVVQLSAWQRAIGNRETIDLFRAIFRHTGVGTPTTPGALGRALQLRAYKEQWGENEEWKSHRHQLPSGWCAEEMWQHGMGARSELFVDPTSVFSEVIELDQKNAYGAAFCDLPDGPTFHLVAGELSPDCLTYWCECTVTVGGNLPLGPFPVRREDGALSFPREAGTYTTWLWKEEVAAARDAGCQVEVARGYGWKKMTTDMSHWVALMGRLRDTAPSSDVADSIKLALVAGIGRHGMKWERATIVDQAHMQRPDVAIGHNGVAYDWFIHWEADHHPSSMTHWFYYCLMRCRLSLYQFSLPYAQSETMLASNTDACYVSRETPVEEIPEKSVPGLPTGTWRRRVLTGKPDTPTFPYLRAIDTLEKEAFPGRKKPP